MPREAPRTLHSLSPDYQDGVSGDDYEIIAIENGSSRRLAGGEVEAIAQNIRYHYHATDSVSPAAAVNRAAAVARGEALAIIVDGARMATPGLVAGTLRGMALFPDAVVGALAWHLGPDVQNKSMLDGYDQRAEDALLASIDWPADGYRLFEIATLAQSSAMGFLRHLPSEYSWVALSAGRFRALGGFCEQFTSPGGGLVNQHFRNRLMQVPNIRPVMLLGEGVFHQFHGGVATNVPMDRHPIKDFKAEYEQIVGEPFRAYPTPPITWLGTMPEAARRFIGR